MAAARSRLRNPVRGAALRPEQYRQSGKDSGRPGADIATPIYPLPAYLWSVLRRGEGEGGWLSATVFGAGLVNTAIKLGSIGPGFAAQQAGLNPQLHEALDKMNSVAYIATMLPLSVLMAAAAIVILRTRALPRWLGWMAALIAPALLVNGMFLDAEFGPAFLLFLLWTAIASVVLILRAGEPRPVERDTHVGGAAPVG
jgi:hypothetical protein